MSDPGVPNVSANVIVKHYSDTDASKSKRVRQIIPSITVDEILDNSGEKDTESVLTINLHGRGITRIVHMEKFPNLKSLDLSCNAITHIENLSSSSLEELKLYGNILTSISGLDKLPRLESLSLQHNRIASIANGLSGQRAIKALRLDSNQITQFDPKDFATCYNLESLDVSYNLLQSLSPLKFAASLTYLVACGNQLKNVDCSANVMLTDLDLSFNNIRDVSGLSALVNIQILRISNNAIRSLQPMGQLKKLMELHVASNCLTNLHYVRKQFPNLDYLDVSHNEIDDWHHVEYLKFCASITELYITGNPCCPEDFGNTTDLSCFMPNLHVFNGKYLNGNNEKSEIRTRAVSANTAVTVEEIESQLENLSINLDESEISIKSTFDSIRSLMSSLPLHPRSSISFPSQCSHEPDTITQFSSRCSSRARLQDAILFASKNN